MSDAHNLRAALLLILQGIGAIHCEEDLDIAVQDTGGRSRTWRSEIDLFLTFYAGEVPSARLLGVFVRGCVRDGLLSPETLLGPSPFTGHPEGVVREVWGPRPVEEWINPAKKEPPS